MAPSLLRRHTRTVRPPPLPAFVFLPPKHFWPLAIAAVGLRVDDKRKYTPKTVFWRWSCTVELLRKNSSWEISLQGQCHSRAHLGLLQLFPGWGKGKGYPFSFFNFPSAASSSFQEDNCGEASKLDPSQLLALPGCSMPSSSSPKYCSFSPGGWKAVFTISSFYLSSSQET